MSKKKQNKEKSGQFNKESDSEELEDDDSSSESIESHELTTEREDDSSSLDQSMVNKSKDELVRNEMLEQIFPSI